MRITFVINSLRLGGAQRALLNIVEAFQEHGHQVSLVTLYHKETDFFHLSDGVAHIALGMEGDTRWGFQKASRNFQRVAAIRRAIQETQPDVVISFLPEINILVLLALSGRRIPVIIVEQNDPLRSNLELAWKVLRRLTYPAASVLVCASQGVSDGFAWLAKSKRHVIFNTIANTRPYAAVRPEAYSHPDRKHIIGMGRLHYQKGFDLLAEAYSQFASRYPDWDLTLWGEGPSRGVLETQIRKLNLQDRIFLPGATPDPIGVMKAAHLFVLSSRYEGFGNVLIEAMACGLPVVSFDCPSGPAEIIQNGVTGILIPPQDVSQMAAVMQHLITDEEARRSLASQGSDGLDQFSIEAVYGQWAELLDSTLSR